jgi:YesN/AraC family two-component response regulator
VFERIPSEKYITETTNSFKKIGSPDKGRALKKILKDINKQIDYVAYVKNYVSKNYMYDISFSNIAAEINLSRTYLSMLFNKEMNCSFPEYLSKFRINKAISIISQTKAASFGDVANNVGYNDYAHFSKAFKKYAGFSPREYIRKVTSDNSLFSI